MTLDELSGQTRTTHRSTILGRSSANADKLVLEIEAARGGRHTFEVDCEEVLRLNQPHIFAKDSRGALTFEDGLRCDFTSVLARAKLCEVASALEPFVLELDFAGSAEVCQSLQLKAVEAVRKCLNITTFQQGLDRSRHSAMCDDIARFACNGQGHCHTVSSTMAAFLYPFSSVLGIDVMYRGGYSWDNVNDSDQCATAVEVADAPERHQWIEFTTRPSMQSFACDLWVADKRGADALRWPVCEAYMQRMYPHGKFNIKQRYLQAVSADFDLPVV